MTEPERPLDVARIGFVTRRFHELQGLVVVFSGCGIVLAALLSRAFESGQRLDFMMLAMMASQPTIQPVQWWYRRTFGEIVVTPTAEFLAFILPLATMLGVFGDYVWRVTGLSGPSLASLALALCALSVLARDGRRRLYYAVALAAGVAGTIVTASAPGAGALKTFAPLPAARAEAFQLAYTLAGLSLAFVGFLDHRLLSTTLMSRRRGREQPPGRLLLCASNGWFRAVLATVVFAGAAGSFAVEVSVAGAIVQVALAVAFLAAAILQTAVRFRGSAAYMFDRQREVHRQRLDRQAALVGASEPGWWLIAAAAGAADSWALPHGRFVLLPLALAAWSASVALRDWPERRHYLIGAVAIALSPLVGLGLPPARSSALLVAVVTGSIVAEGLFDYRFFHRHRAAGLVVEPSDPPVPTTSRS